MARSSSPSFADLTTEFFLLGIQLASGRTSLPEASSLKEPVLKAMDAMAADARQRGFSGVDVDDVRYAVAAYLDEMVHISHCPGKEEWNAQPLQAELFGERIAGVNFFERLKQVRARSRAVTEIYYTCMCLGFTGRYRMERGSAYDDLFEELRRELTSKKLPLARHGKRPSGPGVTSGRFPWHMAAAAAVVLALLIFGGLLLAAAGMGDDGASDLARVARN